VEPVSKDRKTEIGYDTDLAWNDEHLCYVYFWLTENPESPYKGAPSMLLSALNVRKESWGDYKKQMRKRDLWLRYSTRIWLTARMKFVLSGGVIPRIDKRDKNGNVRKFSILPAANPVPIPIPNWYRGTIKMTAKGLKVFVQSAHQPALVSKDKSRIVNPFGAR